MESSFQTEEMRAILSHSLKIEESLFSINYLYYEERNLERIKYDPWYQRNYVWNREKASSLIESIFLGTDIPPLVLFEESNGFLEIIDGRQRFETIKKFINNELRLKKSGLTIFKKFHNYYFEDLPEETKETFLSTNLRVFKYTPLGDFKDNETQKNIIKKEIFTRYNSGMTPLKAVETDKALFINDDLNKFIKNNIQSNKKLKEVLFKLLLPEKYAKDIDNQNNLERLLKRIRFLLVIDNIPISYYSWTSGKNDLINKFFEQLSNTTNDKQELYVRFVNKINIVNKVYDKFVETNRSYNYLIFEALYWALSILEKEKHRFDQFITNENVENFTSVIANSINVYTAEPSHYFRNAINRYSHIAEFFSNMYGISFDLYLISSESSKERIRKIKGLNLNKDINKLVKTLRQSKPQSYNKTIGEISYEIRETRFTVRPIYQREESMNVAKASALIESILLGFKIAPIYIYAKENGIKEVIDGQQRILAILAYLGLPYLNENAEDEFSKKNKFALSGLKYLKEFNKKKFKDLPVEAQDRIRDFTFAVIRVEQHLHPEFNPIDLFIRLNNKQYPIKEHSFEMWNAATDEDIIKTIKTNTKKHSDWFYIRTEQSNSRMLNEELYTTILFLEYKTRIESSLLGEKSCSPFIIYAKKDKLVSSVKNKFEISSFLNEVSLNRINKSIIFNMIDETELYVEKIKLLINNDNCNLKTGFDSLINPMGGTRTRQIIFLLWHILSPIDMDEIKGNKDKIYSDIEKLIRTFKEEYASSDQALKLKQFQSSIHDFWKTHKLSKAKSPEFEKV